MGVPDEVDEAPLQGLGGGFAASQEQIQTTQDQVPVLKTQLTVSVLSDANKSGLNRSRLNIGLTVYYNILPPPGGMRRCNLVGCPGPNPIYASEFLPK